MRHRTSALALLTLLPLTLGTPAFGAQKAATARQRPQAPEAAEVPAAVNVQAQASSMEKTRQDFLELLRLHPRLVDVIYHDPSLLSDEDYVKKNAADVASFLEQHPETAQNPEFFLGDEVMRMHDRNARPQPSWENSVTIRMMDELGPFLVFLVVAFVLMWLIRVLLENRRWSRMVKVQTEAHTKLLEKFSSSQDLAAYMETEAGRRFLESAPIPVDLGQNPRLGAPLGRILWSVQVGVIVAMGGLGLLAVRSHVPEGGQALTVFGMLCLMLGIGFLLSAAASYALSRHFGLFGQPHQGPTT